MSLMRILGVRNSLLSFVETVVFFGVAVPAYFLITGMIYVGIAVAAGEVPTKTFHSLGSLFGALPVWMWVIQGAVLLLLIVIYWTPGDEELNRIEVRSLVCFFVLALVAGGIWLEIQYGAVSHLAKKYVEILTKK
ncbi:MAG: hypothetical protein ACYTF6_03105 [Planctomycetota bacterium]|jgi:hypothetical protein